MAKRFNRYAYGDPKAKNLDTTSTSLLNINNDKMVVHKPIDTRRGQPLDTVIDSAVLETHDESKKLMNQDTGVDLVESNDTFPALSGGLRASKFASASGSTTLVATGSRATKSTGQKSPVVKSLHQGPINNEIINISKSLHQEIVSSLSLGDGCRTLTKSNHTPNMSTDSDSSREDTNGAVVDSKEPIKHDNLKMTKPSVSHAAPNRSQARLDGKDEPGPQFSTEELVQKARVDALKRIKLRSKAKEKTSTTALRDLDIARTPLELPEPDNKAENVPITHRPAVDQYLDSSDQHSMAVALPSNKTGNTLQIKQSSSVPLERKNDNKHWQSHQEGYEEGLAVLGNTNSRWANKADMKPIEVEIGSNAWGSSIPSNASQASDDSLLALHSGKAVRSRFAQPNTPSHPLAHWDGSMQAPPADWDDRPRFNSDNVEFHDELVRWLEDVAQLVNKSLENSVTPLPVPVLRNMNNHPDGITMVPRGTTTNKLNAERYGYWEEELADTLKYIRPVQPSDFDDWGKLDMERPENSTIKNETTSDLVTNWVKQREAIRQREYSLMEQREQAEQAEQAEKAKVESKPVPNPNRPKISIYLRPAVSDDIPQMARIYNWYIEHTPRPAEVNAIEDEDMQDRLDDVRACRLPFIVAISRDSDAPDFNDTKSAREKVVGWACAEDFTAADFVERVSVELQIYTDPAYRQLGIGRCLLDKLIDACDRGYLKRGGYTFHCPSEKMHVYTNGGGRDLVKLVFVLRKWKYAKKVVPKTALSKSAHPKSGRKLSDREDDYDIWIRAWLEKWGFEVEGILKGAGAKHGRFVDLVHFGRETSYHPAEGRIPDPIAGIHR